MPDKLAANGAETMPAPSSLSPAKRQPAPQTLYSTADIIKALHATRGRVYLAADQLGCNHTTIYKRMELEPEIGAVIAAERERRIDIAETALDRAVIEGEAWAVCFTLKCIAKDRGYVERQEISGVDGNAIQIVQVGIDTDRL